MKDVVIDVVYSDPGGEGYHCVLYMARLAARLLGGNLVVIRPYRPGRLEKMAGILPRVRNPHSTCLLICPSPSDLNSLLLVEDWRKRYGRVVAWVFDSFWTNVIPQWTRWSLSFDHVFVT